MLTSEEILQMKKVTDLIHSAKKQSKYQIKVTFNLVFEGDKHLMHSLYPPNIVKALEETILAAFLGTARGRLIPAQCSAVILSGISIPWKLPGLWVVVVFAAWVKSSTPYRVCVLRITSKTLYQSSACAATPTFPQPALNLFPLLPPTLLKDKTLTSKTCSWANHMSCFFARPGKDFKRCI